MDNSFLEIFKMLGGMNGNQMSNTFMSNNNNFNNRNYDRHNYKYNKTKQHIKETRNNKRN